LFNVNRIWDDKGVAALAKLKEAAQHGQAAETGRVNRFFGSNAEPGWADLQGLAFEAPRLWCQLDLLNAKTLEGGAWK